MAESTKNREDGTLIVTGRGAADAEPDLTVLRFEISAGEDSYSDSIESLNERVESLRRAFEEARIERKLLKTTSFQVREDSRYDRKREKKIFLGFIASHGLRLELAMDRELLNRAIGSVAGSASEASVKISFDVSDKESLRRRAMREAVADARRNAEVLAEAAGVSLGNVLKMDYSFVEVRHSFGFEYNVLSARTESTAPNIEPEGVEADQSVTVVWEIF